MMYILRILLLFAIIIVGMGCMPSPFVEAKKPAIIEGFVGYSPTQVAAGITVKLVNAKTGKLVDTDTTNFFGKYAFSAVKPGTYLVQIDKIKRKVMVKNVSDNQRLDIDMSAKGGVMDYTKAAVQPTQTKSSSASNSAVQPNRQGNQTLANQIAGSWWGYSGSTERRIGLCPGGRYVDYTESSYSGSSYNSLGDQTMAWGNANQQGGQGRWSVQGTTESGTIYVQYNNGESRELNYRRFDSNCLKINGNTLCKQSATCQ